jgi:hypothetical protein
MHNNVCAECLIPEQRCALSVAAVAATDPFRNGSRILPPAHYHLKIYRKSGPMYGAESTTMWRRTDFGQISAMGQTWSFPTVVRNVCFSQERTFSATGRNDRDSPIAAIGLLMG